MPATEEAPMARSSDSDSDIPLAAVRLIVDGINSGLKSQAKAIEAQAKATEAQTTEIKNLREDVQRLAPSPRLIAATAGSVMLGVFALLAFMVGLIASGNGIDPRPAAEAASVVVKAVRTDVDASGDAESHDAGEPVTPALPPEE